MKFYDNAKLIFDFDGVLRDTVGYIANQLKCPFPNIWDWKYNHKNIYELVGSLNFSPLINAKPTFVVDEINTNDKIQEVEVWTCQPDDWRPYTTRWMDKYIHKSYKITYFDHIQNKESRLYSPQYCNTYLVEDYPFFRNYERIILFPYPYNAFVRAHRVYTQKDLSGIIADLFL